MIFGMNNMLNKLSASSVIFVYMILSISTTRGQSIKNIVNNQYIVDSLLSIHINMDSISYLRMMRYSYPSKKIKREHMMMRTINNNLGTKLNALSKKRLSKKRIYKLEHNDTCTRYVMYGGYFKTMIYVYRDSISIDLLCFRDCLDDNIYIDGFYNFEYIRRHIIPYIEYQIYFGRSGFFSYSIPKE